MRSVGANEVRWVHEIIDFDARRWDLHQLHTSFAPDSIAMILEVPIRNMVIRDQVVSKEIISGYFTIKSAYNLVLKMD